jgi:hypothetical protein
LNLQSSSLRLKSQLCAFAGNTNCSREGATKENPRTQRVAALLELHEKK